MENSLQKNVGVCVYNFYTHITESLCGALETNNLLYLNEKKKERKIRNKLGEILCKIYNKELISRLCDELPQINKKIKLFMEDGTRGQ